MLTTQRSETKSMPILSSSLTTIVLTAALSAASLQQGQQTKVGSGGSPHWKAQYTIDGATLVVEYGRPSLKGRPEAQLMPPGKPWRTGADEATIITTDKALMFGAVTLQPGTYTINTQPGDTWQLIFGKLDKPGQWGIPYQAPLEIGRVPMTTGKTKAPVEQVTISIDDTAAGATLRIEWGATSAAANFKVRP
jgi:hypothetical protein